ncbi:SRPBCC domain-containing protein [Asticcacaulis excentricus]|uniref:SRPBCC domain-containing protein n=1 Tax=Asticcacaulis excentricus TaxID=78587 RepID=UPI000F82588C|nr:SRPBCC domain-containing protein [Asticcacaulis excentricus]
MSEIIWPEGYVPGFTDNYCSNEVITAGLTAEDIWPFLNTPSYWPTYYRNCADICLNESEGPELENGSSFSFTTFGFPVNAQVVEHVSPILGQAVRLAWHGWSGEEGTTTRLDVHHAWLIEDLSGGRVRILTQETQNGVPAQELAKAVPNPMINGHQEWLDGLVQAARRYRDQRLKA